MMADSTKNNTRHGGVDRNEVAHSLSPGEVENQRTISQNQSSSYGPLHSPTIQESGYNTDSSPATTSSFHETPGRHFDFDSIAGADGSMQRPDADIPTNTTRTDDDHSHSLDTLTPPDGRSHRPSDEENELLASTPFGSSRTRSFHDLHLHGVNASDDDQDETEKDDVLTSSEERFLRDGRWSKGRSCSLRRKFFDVDVDEEAMAYASDSPSKSLPLPILNFQHSDSHESQSDPNSPTASSVFPGYNVAETLQQFLGQDITASSIGIGDEQSEEPEERSDPFTTVNVTRRNQEYEGRLFRVSVSSEDCEEGIPEAGNDGDGDDNVFSFDFQDSHFSANNESASRISSNSQSQPSVERLRHSTNSSPSIVTDKPPISPSYLSSSERRRKRHLSSSVKLQLSGGACIPHLNMPGSFSVGTQTPHRNSLLIQNVLEFPVGLPNEARGTAVSRLRRLSESGAPLPPSPAPLPDIIPFVRDRSSSAPDIQSLNRRRAIQTGRLVGRELRRMSDEFNLSWRSSFPANTELGRNAASFPGVGPLWSIVQGAFRSRRSSSVDNDDDTGSNTES